MTHPAMRVDIGRGVENGEGRAVYLGIADHLADLFESVTPRAYGDAIETIEKYAPYRRNDGPGAILHGFATVELKRPGGLHLAANVRPTNAVRAVIRDQMIKPGRDTLTFTLIEWPDGRTLVTCENSQIIGGIWLAFLSPEATAELHEAMTNA